MALTKVHLGCGRKILPGWVNLDGDSKETIITRYKIDGDEAAQIRDPKTVLVTAELTALPFADASVDIVLCEGVLEHIGFGDEEAVWTEMTRILKVGGLLEISVPDFDALCRLWARSESREWKGWWNPGAEEGDQTSWFHHGTANTNDRWGYLLACFFGNQSSAHQCHLNAYNRDKIVAILETLHYSSWDFTFEHWKGQSHLDPMIRVRAVK